MVILDDGGYEIRQWVRMLTDFGMCMDFSGVGNGEIFWAVSGDLRKH